MSLLEKAGLNAYTPREEQLNVFTHAVGALLSVAATALLVVKASLFGNAWHIVSFSIFGASLMILYTNSTLYHAARKPSLRTKLRILDHTSIYVLIAGSYTPFTLVTLHGATGWWIFGSVWAAALVGIVLKLFYTGRYDRLSTAMYLVMGWIIILALKPLLRALPPDGTAWLAAGGIAYTVGAVLYSIKRIPYNHAIFHVFVIAGSVCHFVSVYFYVLERP